MEKKTLAIVAGLALLVSSCRVSEKATGLSPVDGEWTIEQAGGVTVSPDNEGQMPYVGFITSENRVYGNSGCNRISGSFETRKKNRSLRFGHFAATMRMCPDMATEEAVLKALDGVASYRAAGKQQLELCDAQDRVVAKLTKRFEPLAWKALGGRWFVSKVYGRVIDRQGEERPYMEIVLTAGKLYGFAGCNRMSGTFRPDTTDTYAFSVSQLSTTRMMCPDMDVEADICNALARACRAGKLTDGNVALYDKDGMQLFVLTRK